MTYVARTRRAALQILTAVSLTLAALVLVISSNAKAAEAVLQRGDAAVTGFSGAQAEPNIPDDVHPLDRTVIDLDGASVKIFGLQDMGTAPRGQLSDIPALRTVKARDVGQVFGIALGERKEGTGPDIYVAATSSFGLQIVAPDGKGGFTRRLQGAPRSQWMAGQFGPGPDATPGSIYKIDGATGAVSLFANVVTDGRPNSGPGLGNLAYDAKTRQLFVSDLETGLIHRITLDGKDRDTFDHGEAGRKAQGLDVIAYDPARRMSIESPAFDSEDTATWGIADERRRVFGLGVNRGRLYYAVAEGPAIWSVSIDDEGDFGNDPRIELEVPNTPAGTNITSITFDGAGMMYLAQRGAIAGSYDYSTFATAQQAVLVRYRWDDKEGRWSKLLEEYAVGLSGEYRSTVGGVALNYGYDNFGRIDYGKCRQTVWTTGEHLREGEDVVRVANGGAKTVHGLQGMYKSRVRPQNEPPYESWFTDYDGLEDDPATYGQVGAVAIYAPCDGAPEPTAGSFVTPEVLGLEPPLDDPGLIIDKRCFGGAPGGKVRCTISVRNTMDHAPLEDLLISDVTRILVGPGHGLPVPVVAVDIPFPSILCAATPTPDFTCTIPAALLMPGDTIALDVWVDTHDLTLKGNLGFRNCAKIKHQDGYGKACAEGGTDIVVEKIGPGTCDAGGACKFGLRIANAGTMPFNGDVLLADAMFIGGGVPNVPVTSVNPPIACSAGNTAQLPFTCQTHLSLMPGEDHIHWIEVTMPAPGGYTAENCFGALDPLLVPVGPMPVGFGEAGTGNPSCVSVTVPAPAPKKMEQPQKIDPPLTLIKQPRCEDGRVRRANGTCPCPQATIWSEGEDRCVPLRQRCADPDRRKDDGSCCPRGTYYDDESSRCRAPDPGCPDPERRRDDGSCCPRGTVVSDNGNRCVGIEIACPAGTRWSYGSDTCLPLRPVCNYGERYDWRRQMCIPLYDDCPRGSRFNRHTRECEYGGASCPEGTHWSRSRHSCVKDETHASCPDGSPRLANGSCRCPLNKRWNEKMQECGGGSHTCPPSEMWIGGRCVPTGTHIPIPCPAGQHRIGKICVPNMTTPGGDNCPAGQHRVGRICVPDRTPGDDSCGPGKHRVGKMCLPDRTPGTEPCAPGQHRVGRVCVPDSVKVPGKPPVVTGCPDGQIKIGSRCIPQKVIRKDPPKIEKPVDIPKRIPKPDVPKIKVKPEIKVRPPVIKPTVKPPVVRTPTVKVKPPVFKPPVFKPKVQMPSKTTTPNISKGLPKGPVMMKPNINIR